MRTDALVRARDRLIAAAGNQLTFIEVLTEIISAFHLVADFRECALILTDPETMLPSAAVVEAFEVDQCAPFWDNELLDPDFVKFNELARRRDPVATLHEATDGDLARSPRFVKMLSPLGAADELRIAFTSGSTCWAVGALVRTPGLGPFTPDEIAAVRALAPTAVRALRQAAGTDGPDHWLQGPAMIVIAPTGEIASMTADAARIISDLRTEGLDESAPPSALMAVARRARTNRSTSRVALRARGLSGSWLKLHASPLGDDGSVAVMIEPARPTDLVPILLESYGATDRETEVVFLIARGLATKEIAAEMCLSVHTVNDHIKSIFTKTGVSTRGELVARLFSEHLYEAYEKSVAHLDGPSETPISV